MLKKIKLPTGWFYFASLYTCTSLGSWIFELFHESSKISGYIVFALAFIINWNTFSLLRKAEKTWGCDEQQQP